MVLDDLFLPDTPPEVKQAYLQYADEAKVKQFSLLEQEIVVLDTETTGLSFKDSDLIEIAAVKLQGSEITDRFQTFVHPTTPIPESIKKLTGITNADVTDAPSAKQAVNMLAEFAGGLPIVAHNAQFDRQFIVQVPGADKVSNLWIDSLALSRIALPRLSSHKLGDMAQAFGCATATHRAMDDVEALCGIWRIILVGLSHLPQGLLANFAKMHPSVNWPYRDIFSQLSLELKGSVFSFINTRKTLMSSVVDHEREDALTLIPDIKVPSTKELQEDFAYGGLVDQMYGTYEVREEQQIVSEAILNAFKTSSNLAVEAGTGVGKSVAYLLPSILLAKMNNITCGVATKTNALTDQLMTHELPLLDSVIDGGVKFFSLKGYDRYPCMRKLQSAFLVDLPDVSQINPYKSKNTIECDILNAIAIVSAFACQSTSGDLDNLGIRWSTVPKSLITCTPKECTKSRCPFFTKGCFVHDARRRASSADIVVTNHSLLLRNVEADGNILPPIRHWIIDEAHSFESEARVQWAQEVSADKCYSVLELLGSAKTGIIHTLMVEATASDSSGLLARLLTQVASKVKNASQQCAFLFDAIRDLSSLNTQRSSYATWELWINDEVRQTEQWQMLLESGTRAVEALDQAVKALSETEKAICEAIESPSAHLSDGARDLGQILAALRLILEGTDDSYVFSAVLPQTNKGLGTEKLVAQKIDVGEVLAEKWLPEMLSVVFTSATIAIGDDFAHFKHEVGLDRAEETEAKTLKVASSFDYDTHMKSIVVKDLAVPNTEQYLQDLSDMLYDVHKAMDGSVLTLFTNRREMEFVYQNLKPRLEKDGLQLLCQTKNASAQQLRKQFKEQKSSSLFALKAFWEGFDAAGETLRCVVITKLPFANPSDPLVRERDLRESRSWWKYSLPEAVISVKQAAGRLIRSQSDKGVLILCDGRLVSKPYGKQFIKSLPTSECDTLSSDFIGRYIEMWRSSNG